MTDDRRRFPHHPYRNGYSVLPRMRKISIAEVFEHDSLVDEYYVHEKRRARQSQLVSAECDLSDELRLSATDFLIEHYPKELNSASSLEEIALQIQPDIVLHATDDHRDWMAFGHVCFPSGWRPEEKIGQPLAVIHRSVPGMDLSKSRKLVETIVHHGPFERFVWSVVFENKLNFHPDHDHAPFNALMPQLFVKIERQVTVGFPEQNGTLFLLRQSLLPEYEIDVVALRDAIAGMSAAERHYKGLAESADAIISHLDRSLSGEEFS